MGELFSKPYDLLLGRKTYEIFAAHWPYAEDTADDEIAEGLQPRHQVCRDLARRRR